MALRYLARRALQQRRALVPRVALPSAGSRPVCTSGGSSPPPPPPPQGVLINESKAAAAAAAAASKGNKEPELLHTDSSKLTDNAQMCQKLDAIIEGLKEYARYQQEQANHDWCLMMGSAVAAGVGLAFLHIAYDIRKEIEITLAEEVVDSMMKIVLQRLLWNWQLMLEDSSKDGEDKQDQDI